MSHNKYKILIEYSHSDFYKVSLTDHNGARTVVYEPSVDRAFDYAINWCRESDTREEARQTHAKAVMEMMKLDRQAGITTNTNDGLD
jgi:lauroyl/myristoyl acyltransferase